MATTYGQRRTVIAEITARLAANRNRLDNSVNQINTAKSDLDSIPITLKTFLDDIAADAGKGNAAFDLMSAEAIILLDECAALSQTADTMAKALP